MRHRSRPPSASRSPPDTSRTSDDASGTWASSATLTNTCPRSRSRSPTSRWRRGSSAENGSSSSRTGRSRTSSATALASPSRRHKAAAQASPWLAKLRAPRSRTASVRSSRCGPTKRGPSDELVRPAFGQTGLERLLERLAHDVRSVRRTRARTRRGAGTPPPPVVASACGGLGVGAGPARCPFLTSSASQASSPVGAPRPSHSFSKRLRWRRVALVRRHGGLLERPERADGVVEEVAPLGRVADHDDEVVGAEEHRPNLPAQIALAPHRRPVHLDAVRSSAGDLHLDQDLARLLGQDLAARVRRPVRVAPDDRLGRGGSRRLEEEQEGDPLEQVGLALAVRAGDRHRAPRAARPGASRRGCGSPGARPTRAATRRQPTGVGSLTGITRYVNSSDSPRTIPGFRPSRTSSRTDSPDAAARPSAR